MKRLLFALALVFLSTLYRGVLAQDMLPLMGVGAAPPLAGNAYTGPGDVVAGAKGWYSCTRAYNAAYATGSNVGCNIIRASDSDACDLLITSSGTMGNTVNCGVGGDNGQSAVSFCTSTTCTVTKLYDQTGTTNATMSNGTVASQFTLTFSCIGSFACITGDGTGNKFYTNESGTVAYGNQPGSFSAVAKRTGNFSAANNLMLLGGAVQLGFNSTGNANDMFVYAGTQGNFATAGAAAWLAVEATVNGSSSAGSVNGVDHTSLAAGANNPGTVAAQISRNGSQQLTGSIAEVGYWPSGFTSGNRTSMCQNQQAYYGAGNFGATC